MTLQLRSNKKCLSHHYACDCREDYFADLVDENDNLKKRVKAAETLLKTLESNGLYEVMSGSLATTVKVALSAFWKEEAGGVEIKEELTAVQQRDKIIRECRKALADSELVQRGDQQFLLMPYSFIKSSAFSEPNEA